ALTTLQLANEVHQPLSDEETQNALQAVRLEQGVSKQMVLLNASRAVATKVLEGCTFVTNREGRVKNINDAEGSHLYSPRLRDGGLSLANAGALALLGARSSPLPTTCMQTDWRGSAGDGPAVVVVDDDAVPFVRKGRNVFHGFVRACDPWLNPGEACLITDLNGTLLGHGVAQCTSGELGCFTKGIAVKTRGGFDS
ncbi:MAG: hypothetical protein ISP84_05830, partial [Candidatus Poseidonia sp.]|nr:hypothetical protein [Poseidonia sp.]